MQSLKKSLSSDKIKALNLKGIQNDQEGDQQQHIIARLTDRLSQNPMAVKSGSFKSKLQLQSSNKVGSNDGDNLRKIESPNDDIDERESDDCEEG